MRFVPLLFTLVPASVASACPLCKSETADAVRAGLVDGNLAISIAATVLPFVLVLGVVACLHFGATRRGRGR